MYNAVRNPYVRLGDFTDFFSGDDAGGSSVTNAASAYESAAADLAKRAAEAQKQAIITGAQQAAAGFKTTAAQIESDVQKRLLKAALVGGGVYAFAKWKGWI